MSEVYYVESRRTPEQAMGAPQVKRFGPFKSRDLAEQLLADMARKANLVDHVLVTEEEAPSDE